jgi:cobalamin biosynthesis Mg chelatase CobN
MSLIDTIKKLEYIKQNYIIDKLEKFTEQLAATSTQSTPSTSSTSATTATPATPTTTATPATTTTTATTATTTTTATPATPKKSEEEKKPDPIAGDAKKFEKNIMDTLKWVFIGIGIFVLLLIILGIIYWLMFGSNKEDIIEEQNIYNIPPEPLMPPTIDSTRPLLATTVNNKDVVSDNKNNSIFSFITSFNKKEEVPEIINNEELKVNKTIIPLSSSSPSSSSSSPSSSSSTSSSTTSTSSSSSSISSETPIPQNNKNESIFSYIDPFSKKNEEIKVAKSIAPLIPEVPSEVPNKISPQNKKDESIFSFMSPLSKKDEEIKVNNSIIPEAKLSSESYLSPNDEKYKINYIAKK